MSFDDHVRERAYYMSINGSHPDLSDYERYCLAAEIQYELENSSDTYTDLEPHFNINEDYNKSYPVETYTTKIIDKIIDVNDDTKSDDKPKKKRRVSLNLFKTFGKRHHNKKNPKKNKTST